MIGFAGLFRISRIGCRRCRGGAGQGICDHPIVTRQPEVGGDGFVCIHREREGVRQSGRMPRPPRKHEAVARRCRDRHELAHGEIRLVRVSPNRSIDSSEEQPRTE